MLSDQQGRRSISKAQHIRNVSMIDDETSQSMLGTDRQARVLISDFQINSPLGVPNAAQLAVHESIVEATNKVDYIDQQIVSIRSKVGFFK